MRLTALLLCLCCLVGCNPFRSPEPPPKPVTRVDQLDPDGPLMLVTRDVFNQHWAELVLAYAMMGYTIEGVYDKMANEAWVVCRDPLHPTDYEMWVIAHEIAHRTDHIWGHELGTLYWHGIPLEHRTHPDIEGRLCEWRAIHGLLPTGPEPLTRAPACLCP
jgi:hypothetical protein